MKSTALLLATLGLVACTTNKTTETTANQTKSLVLYYSQVGATRTVAQEIQKQTNADIQEIEVVNAYDGDFQQTIARCQQEMAEGTLPELKALEKNVADYDTIYLGFPIWFGTYAPPIASLVKDQAFEGKTVITFCTFGSGGLQPSSAALKAAIPQANVIEGYGVRTARVASAPAEINRFLCERGYVAGEVEALPAYGEEHPVSDEEAAIFNQACGDYQFPLGTPVSVASRTTSTSTDYCYKAASQAPNGEQSLTTIYVTVGNDENAKPEFTQVVR